MAAHAVLYGDSIFDNKRYVLGEAVIDYLRKEVKATLRAVDGHIIKDVPKYQTVPLPSDATHIFLSVGGNDGLQYLYKIWTRFPGFFNFFPDLYRFLGDFEMQYEDLVCQLKTDGLPVCVCTIYVPDFKDKRIQFIARAGLFFINNVIWKVASRQKVKVIDLYNLLIPAEDLANQIEPGELGGQKIAKEIVRIVRE